jgi:hypothetical protein
MIAKKRATIAVALRLVIASGVLVLGACANDDGLALSVPGSAMSWKTTLANSDTAYNHCSTVRRRYDFVLDKARARIAFSNDAGTQGEAEVGPEGKFYKSITSNMGNPLEIYGNANTPDFYVKNGSCVWRAMPVETAARR